MRGHAFLKIFIYSHFLRSGHWYVLLTSFLLRLCQKSEQSSYLKSLFTDYFPFNSLYYVKVHIFWEGHTILGNLHQRFDRYYIRQIYAGDFTKFCGLLRIYELHFSSILVSQAYDLSGKSSKKRRNSIL